jgi:hypothetical protein
MESDVDAVTMSDCTRGVFHVLQSLTGALDATIYFEAKADFFVGTAFKPA